MMGKSKSSYTRPGVEAAARLSKMTNVGVWGAIEDQYEEMLAEKGGKKLVLLNQACNEAGERWRRSDSKLTAIGNDDEHYGSASTSVSTCCTLKELETIIEWKFAKGKPRPLWKHIRSNSEQAVQDASRLAFSKIADYFEQRGDGNTTRSAAAFKECLREAINDITVLKGIGPASASAILSLYRPDLFVFMDDEVIECLHPGKRVYTLPIYLEINSKCQKLAGTLGEGWTPRRVGSALWTAAKVCASSSDGNRIDLTLERGNKDTNTAPTNNDRGENKKRSADAAPSDKTNSKCDDDIDENSLPVWKRRRRKLRHRTK